MRRREVKINDVDKEKTLAGLTKLCKAQPKEYTYICACIFTETNEYSSV